MRLAGGRRGDGRGGGRGGRGGRACSARVWMARIGVTLIIRFDRLR